MTQEFLDEHDLALVVHGDDVGAYGFEDVYGPVLEAGLLRLVPRTGDISTTQLIARVRASLDR